MTTLMLSAVTCEDPGLPTNGHHVVSYLKFGGVANFTCNEGFKLVGPQTMRCLASGNWLGRVPTCEGWPLSFKF